MKVYFHPVLPFSALVHDNQIVELGLVFGTPSRPSPQRTRLTASPAILALDPSPDPPLALYSARVDTTATKVQEVAKSKDFPWSAAKRMDALTPIG